MILITKEQFEQSPKEYQGEIEMCLETLIDTFKHKYGHENINFDEEVLEIAKYHLNGYFSLTELTKENIENINASYKITIGDLVFYTNSTISDFVDVLIEQLRVEKAKHNRLKNRNTESINN